MAEAGEESHILRRRKNFFSGPVSCELDERPVLVLMLMPVSARAVVLFAFELHIETAIGTKIPVGDVGPQRRRHLLSAKVIALVTNGNDPLFRRYR